MKETNRKQEQQRAFLRRRLHVLSNSLGLYKEDYRAFLGSYGVQTSTDLCDRDLRDAVMTLEHRLYSQDVKKSDDCDKWRKRVMGAIGGWLNHERRTATLIMIKAIAERAARVKVGDFNKIDRKTLIRIYNEFKCKTAYAVSSDEKTGKI